MKFILNIKYFFPHDIIQSFTLTPNRKNIFLVALLYSEGKLTFFDLAKSDCQKTFLCNNNPVTCTFWYCYILKDFILYNQCQFFIKWYRYDNYINAFKIPDCDTKIYIAWHDMTPVILWWFYAFPFCKIKPRIALSIYLCRIFKKYVS